MKANQLQEFEEFVLKKIEGFKKGEGSVDSITILSNGLSGITYTFKNVPKEHDSRVNYSTALARFMLVIDQYKFALIGDDQISEETYDLSEAGEIDRRLINYGDIVNYRVKLLPDQINVICYEGDLHPWIENKIFHNRDTSEYTFLNYTIMDGIVTNIISNNNNLYRHLHNVRDGIMRCQPSFNNNWLLDLVLYHDYLKNVVIGHMRSCMIEFSNSICRENLRSMGDTDGDI